MVKQYLTILFALLIVTNNLTANSSLEGKGEITRTLLRMTSPVPDPFKNLVPVDGGVAITHGQLFDWTDYSFENDGVNENDEYHVILYTDAAGTNPFMSTTLPHTTSQVSSFPLFIIPLGQYWWGVRVQDDGVISANTVLTSFTIGNAAPPEIEVQRPVGTPIAHDGTDNVGTKEGSRFELTYTISNSGESDLLVTNAAVTNMVNCTAGLNSSIRVTIGENGSETNTIYIDPIAPGPFSVDYTVSSNDPDEAAYVIHIQGDAGSPEIDIQDALGNSIANGGVDDVGDNLSGVAFQTPYSILNLGNGKLTFSNYSTGSLVNCTCTITNISSSVDGGASEPFTFGITPTAAGLFSVTFIISSNDADEDPYTFTITGTGLEPEINLKEGANDIADGGSYDFGNKSRLSHSDAVFTIENLGDAVLDLSGTPIITIAGADAGEFSLQVQPSTPIAPAGNTTFTVRFSPTTFGVKVAAISIVNSDFDENPYDLTITGICSNSAPVLASTEPTDLTYTENSGPVSITSTITVTDDDDTLMESAVVQITNNYINGEDVLEFADTGAITGTWDAATGKVTLNGTDTKANYETALRNVKYKNDLENPTSLVNDAEEAVKARAVTATPRTVSFSIFDGDDNSNTETRILNIVSVNDNPVIKYNEGAIVDEAGTVVIYQYQLMVKDPEGSSYLVYTLLSAPANGVLNLDGVEIPAMGTFTQKDINEWKLTYVHNGSETTSDQFTFDAYDNDRGKTSTATFHITINPVDNPPAQPTNLVIGYDTDGSIVLTWTDNSDNEISYEVWRQMFTDAKHDFIMAYELIATLEADSETFTDYDISEGEKYQYLLKAVNGSGSTELITGEDGNSENPVAPLSTPTNLLALANSDKSIALTWNDNSSMEEGYTIYRRIQNEDWQSLANIAANNESYLDSSVDFGVTYYYAVRAYNSEIKSVYSNEDHAMVIITGVDDWVSNAPREFKLNQNYPNPFNPSTTISYGLPSESYVRIAVYNMIGEEIALLKEGFQSAGYHSVSFYAENISSGIYLYKISAQSSDGDDQIDIVRKMMLMK